MILMVQEMGYLEDRNSHGNLDRLFGEMSLRGEDGTVLGYSVIYSYVFSKLSTDGNSNGCGYIKVKMTVIWFL